MRKNNWIALVLVLILPAMLFTVSCAKKTVESEPAPVAAPEPAQPPEDKAAMQQQQQEAEKARMEADRLKAEEAERARLAGEFVNEDINFEFDSSALLPSAQQVLTKKADYLMANPGVKATVEGHCDERGTEAYNLALGERRAESAKAFLINLGINAGRLSTISYGEERPLDPAANEEAWAKNRRAHFVID